MSKYLSFMFDNGENSKARLEWDFLDTPPARSWQNMLQYTLENPTDHALPMLEASFCNTEEQARELWTQIRADISEFRLPYDRIQFSKLTSGVCSNVMQSLITSVQDGKVGGISNAMKINKIISKLKNVMFYLNKVVEPQSVGNNTDSAFGEIWYVPEPHFAVEFKPEWLEHITMQIEPGTVYAELVYAGSPWYDILQHGDVKQAHQAIKEKRFGPPTHLGSGCLIPFSQDIASIETELLTYFVENRGMLEFLDPTFDPVYAWKSCGRVPVARLRSEIGKPGNPGFEQLSSITGLFKVELLEDY